MKVLRDAIAEHQYENSDIPSRWIFFLTSWNSVDFGTEKYTPTVTSRSTPRFGGVCTVYVSKML